MKQDKQVDNTARQEQINQLAKEVLQLSRDHIVVNLQFMDEALLQMQPKAAAGLKGMAADGKHLYYDPDFVLKSYKEEPNLITRTYLHMLLHNIFFHGFQYQKVDNRYWDFAVDMAVEQIILELHMPNTALFRDDELEKMLKGYKREAGKLTAERLYKNFLVNEPSNRRMQEIEELFKRDEHIYWGNGSKEELAISFAQWKKISERIKADVKTFSKDKNEGKALSENLTEATREKYDYAGFLQRFMSRGETMRVNDEEFDYIYYTYGLSQYGNMPLVEPLEYADDKKIKEFVIAIDTSSSCKGRIVQAFLRKTYSIMKSSEHFFQKINVHIIQCDSQVQSDSLITSQEDFEQFMKQGKLVGFGSTDFRPVFDHVEKLKSQRAFTNLKGMIYFTDGYGIYPQKPPEYEVAFVFLKEDELAPEVPPWAVKVILEEEDLAKEALEIDENRKAFLQKEAAQSSTTTGAPVWD